MGYVAAAVSLLSPIFILNEGQRPVIQIKAFNAFLAEWQPNIVVPAATRTFVNNVVSSSPIRLQYEMAYSFVLSG